MILKFTRWRDMLARRTSPLSNYHVREVSRDTYEDNDIGDTCGRYLVIDGTFDRADGKYLLILKDVE